MGNLLIIGKNVFFESTGCCLWSPSSFGKEDSFESRIITKSLELIVQVVILRLVLVSEVLTTSVTVIFIVKWVMLFHLYM